MAKRILFVLFAVIFIFSLSAINAADINSTDDIPLQIENSSQVNSVDSDINSLNENDKNQTEMVSQSDNVYYKGSYSVTLKDSNSGSILANKTIDFLINNVKYDAVTDNDGVANVNLALAPGKYSIFASFSGDDDYGICNLTSTFNVLPTIKASDISKYYKSSTPFSAQFFDSHGNPLANTMVTITVNGKQYNVRTNGNGFANLAMNFNPGSYKIVSTNPLMGYSITTNFLILPTLSSSDIKQVQGQNKKFIAKFLRSDGKPLAKTYVKYKLKGKTHKVKTNANGMISISLKKLKKGTYKIVCYNKDGLSKTNTIKIYKKKASTKLSAKSYTFYPKDKGRVITVKLSTALADSSNAGKIIKIKINKKTYSRKTDANGIASMDLSSFKKGIFNVQFKYDGNKFFKASKLTRSVTIFDTTQTSITVKSTTHFGYGAGTSLKVSYNAGGVPLAGKTVKLTLAGKTYAKTTDSKGIVSIPINLDIGDYVVSYKTDSDSIFNGTSGSFNIDVFKRSPSKLTWKCGKSYKDNTQTFKVLATNLKGQHLSGGDIELTIDGETYSSTVSSGGYAKFKTHVAIGNYKVSVKFKGNNNHLESSASKSVKVKLSKFRNGINEKNAKGSKAYKKSSSHCKVGTKKIKKLVKKLTKGLKSKVDKARAIFNYVRDTLDYSYYYDTKYGSTGTLNRKSGNCVDHSHLLVAMYRTAGFNARYVHGTCRFSDGDVTGHVWVQVKIGKNWVGADAISYRNSLGKIKNWNNKHYTLHNKYASLPF